MSSTNRITEISALEHSTLKVPYEILNKKFRFAQKTIDREISHVQHGTGNLEKLLQKEQLLAAELDVAVGAVVEKLTVLSEKSSLAIADETEAATIIKRRIDHLKVKTDNSASDTAAEQWRRLRIDRLLIEFLLRAGHYETAAMLAERTGMGYMSNLSVFLTAQEVKGSLERKETGRCLEWCYDHRSKLRRLRSRLELRVREQEFIELIRNNRRMEAVTYARTYFSPVEEEMWKDELEKVVALLGFRPDTQIPAYQELFSDSRWESLVRQFESENFRLYQLAHQSVFSACLQTGVSALKTPHCHSLGLGEGFGRNNKKQCPVCHPDVNKLAKNLPFAHASQSRLICAYSGEPLNENNPPMMLPNGMVYGRTALQQLALQSENGTVTCPRTGYRCGYDSAQRVYLM